MYFTGLTITQSLTILHLNDNMCIVNTFQLMTIDYIGTTIVYMLDKFVLYFCRNEEARRLSDSFNYGVEPFNEDSENE